MSVLSFPVEKYQQSLEKLQGYCEERAYQGYDPYDILMSPFPFRKLGKWPSVLAIQAFKRNPINLRPLFSVKPSVNPKGLGLFLHGYSLLPASDRNRAICDKLFQQLLDCRSKGIEGLGWGYQFGWASPVKYLPPYDPTAVVSGFIAKALAAYYRRYQNPEAKKALAEICVFFRSALFHTKLPEGIAISYSTRQADFCYNASLLAAEVYAINAQLNETTGDAELISAAVKAVLPAQKADGSWNYSRNLNSGIEREQVDFHQGYVVESLINIAEECGVNEPDTAQAIASGFDFYIRHQFSPEGRAKWRLPKEWPADIHHQAQGIITACRYFSYANNVEALQKACTIADYTLREFQSKEGFFYYRQYRYFKDKTPYMRWGQAWMFLALSTLLNTISEYKKLAEGGDIL